MNRVSVDQAGPEVKSFFRTLPTMHAGVELELDGKVIGTFVPFDPLSEPEKQALLRRGRDLVRRARERNQDVPEHELIRLIDEAVSEVRERQR